MKNTLDWMEARLLEKYNSEAFMYVEYPHRKYWTQQLDDTTYRSALKELFSAQPDPPLLLYVHMPYCPKQCWFCTCHVEITLDYENVRTYLNHLYREIDLFRDFFEQHSIKPNFKEIHLGGGSPTYIKEPEFDQLIEKLGTVVDLKNLREFCIEIDPRRVKKERMIYYHEKGINRVSFGVQDFELEVQKAVNRVQPAKLTASLLDPEIRQLFKNGVNFDVICGLPRQTVDSIRRTMEIVSELSPDRICFNYLHMSPKFAPHQLLMPQEALPNVHQKKELFLAALEVLTKNGYMRTGYDHFAKPADEVSKALERKEMQWNRLGTTPGRYMDVLGIGVSSTSTIGQHYYAQNFFELDKYENAVLSGKLPVAFGHTSTRDDVIRRSVIQTLRNYFTLDFTEIERRFDIVFAEYFRAEMLGLNEFIEDGLVQVEKSAIRITDIGQQFSNLVCRNFDNYLRQQAATQSN